MDLTKLIESLQSTLGQNLPSILGALGILIVGWLVAVIGHCSFFAYNSAADHTFRQAFLRRSSGSA